MGKKNRSMPNSGGNNKDVILKKATIDSLDRQLRDKKELVAEVEDWLAKKGEKEAELRALIEKVSLYGEAKEIIENKEAILLQANAEKDQIELDIASLKASKKDKQEELDSIEKRLGEFETADGIIKSAEDRAEIMINDAKERAAADAAKYEALLADVEKEKKRLLKETTDYVNGMLAKAKDDAEEVLSAAKQSAEIINNEALEKVKQYYSCKVEEGEAQKSAVIEAANQERGRIISQAKTDAETISSSVRAQADDYAKHKREIAEVEAKHIVDEAKAEADHILEEAEKDRQHARTYADTTRNKALEEAEMIREQAYNATVDARKSLDKQLEAAANLQAEYESKLKEVERRSQMLDRREASIDAEVADRAEKECEITKHRFDALRDFANRVNQENKKLNQQMETSNELKAKIIDRDTLNALRQQLEELEGKGITVETADDYVRAKAELKKADKQIEKLKDEKASMASALRQTSKNEDELNTEKERNKFYADTIKELTEELNKSKVVSRSAMIAPIKAVPTFMMPNDLDDDRDIANEIEWLDHIQSQCKAGGLQFTKRQIYAYHTAQKIKDMSPLVVLAGVSGTGKSELPKNYAIHGGMNFLSIPVKPDWDSPASLFGYYNSIERRFEATDLVRALYQMSKDDLRQQQMMMVLLDEMNLAHPEQYFADLLSKLETCRGLSDSVQYDILLGGGETPERLDIGANILWTGTMNEDETTKGLSDKVIDRSTLITFPRPTVLYDRKEITEIKPCFILSKKKWNGWCNVIRESDTVDEKLAEYKEVVERINEQMSGMGRNLGHRVWQGMAKYIKHHPNVVYAKKDDDLMIALSKAFSDSIAFKVMPKLRGVETRGSNEDHLSKIEMLLTANASELVQDYNNARHLTTELFQWCSADFMNNDDE